MSKCDLHFKFALKKFALFIGRSFCWLFCAVTKNVKIAIFFSLKDNRHGLRNWFILMCMSLSCEMKFFQESWFHSHSRLSICSEFLLSGGAWILLDVVDGFRRSFQCSLPGWRRWKDFEPKSLQMSLCKLPFIYYTYCDRCRVQERCWMVTILAEWKLARYFWPCQWLAVQKYRARMQRFSSPILLSMALLIQTPNPVNLLSK